MKNIEMWNKCLQNKLEFGQTQDFSLSDRMSDKSLRNFARSALTLKLISNEYNFTLFIG